ncbi:rho GTPase-activating protein 24-like [Arapaima gigas]
MPEGKQTVCRTSSHLSHSAYRKIKRALSFRRRVFGQRLEETVIYERRYGEHVAPMVVVQCVAFIRERGLLEVGLFRQPGQATLVRELQVAFDAGEKPTFDSTTDVHTVASLLKLYLRELPEPVIPFSRYQDFLMCGKRPPEDRKQALLELKRLLQELPVANFNLLYYICCFLHEVQSYSHINKMSSQNLATVFGPNILRPKAEDPESIIEGAALVQQLMSELIQECGSLFLRDTDSDMGPDLLPAKSRKANTAGDGRGDPAAEAHQEALSCYRQPSVLCSGQLSQSLLATRRGSPQPPEDDPASQYTSALQRKLEISAPGGFGDPLYKSSHQGNTRHQAAVESGASLPCGPSATTAIPIQSVVYAGSAPSALRRDSWGGQGALGQAVEKADGAVQEGCWSSNTHESTLSIYDNIHLARSDETNPPADGMASADSSSWSSCEILLEEGNMGLGPASSHFSSIRTDPEEPRVGSPASLVIIDAPLSSSSSEVFLPPGNTDTQTTMLSPQSPSSMRCFLVGLQQQIARQKEEYEAQIKSLEQRNEALQGEVAALRANLEQQRRWYGVAEMKLRDAERARADADRRNALLQQEMEQFFDTFGELNNEARKAEHIVQSF